MIWLANARILSIFAVVLLHATADVVTGNPVGSGDWWIANVYDSLVRWCVPVFVMISGALLLDPGKKEDLPTFYRKRLSRLLVPTVAWSAFFLCWVYLKGWRHDDPPAAAELVQRLAAGTPYYHMWFLYMIALLYLFTPFFRKIVATSSRSEMTVVVITTMALSAINALSDSLSPGGPQLFLNWFLSYVPYFFLGYLIRSSTLEMGNGRLVATFLLCAALTALGCYWMGKTHGLAAGLYFYGYLSVTVIPMSVSVMYLLKKLDKPFGTMRLSEQWSSLTLGVYLVHPVFLETLPGAWPAQAALSPAMSIPVTAMLVFCLSLASAWGLSRIPYLNRTI